MFQAVLPLATSAPRISRCQAVAMCCYVCSSVSQVSLWIVTGCAVHNNNRPHAKSSHSIRRFIIPHWDSEYLLAFSFFPKWFSVLYFYFPNDEDQ